MFGWFKQWRERRKAERDAFAHTAGYRYVITTLRENPSDDVRRDLEYEADMEPEDAFNKGMGDALHFTSRLK